jgi:hypothetical protein
MLSFSFFFTTHRLVDKYFICRNDILTWFTHFFDFLLVYFLISFYFSFCFKFLFRSFCLYNVERHFETIFIGSVRWTLTKEKQAS